MVSTKERARLARMFDKQQEAINNQRKSITRMNLMLLEAGAALEEIASSEMESWVAAQTRARAALDTMERLRVADAAATTDDGEESSEADDSGPSEGDGK